MIISSDHKKQMQSNAPPQAPYGTRLHKILDSAYAGRTVTFHVRREEFPSVCAQSPRRASRNLLHAPQVVFAVQNPPTASHILRAFRLTALATRVAGSLFGSVPSRSALGTHSRLRSLLDHPPRFARPRDWGLCTSDRARHARTHGGSRQAADRSLHAGRAL